MTIAKRLNCELIGGPLDGKTGLLPVVICRVDGMLSYCGRWRLRPGDWAVYRAVPDLLAEEDEIVFLEWYGWFAKSLHSDGRKH